MRWFTSMAVMALAAAVAAVPITPSAPELQRFAEQMRSEGIAEHDIAKRLMGVPAECEFESGYDEHQSRLSRVTTNLYDIFHTETVEEKRDASGDIAPGSLEGPQMLPRAAAPDSFADRMSQMFSVVFRRGDLERRRFAYEGKELEMRRPTGMRHWNAE